MIDFVATRTGIILEYKADYGGNGWLWSELRRRSAKATISRVFHFRRADLLDDIMKVTADDLGEYRFRFRFAVREKEYYRIAGRIFGIDRDLLIPRTGIDISRKFFVAERNISIPLRLAKLMPAGQDIVIGDAEGAIPVTLYQSMLEHFPGSTELDKYASARVATVLEGFIDPLKDARADYEAYLSRRKSSLSKPTFPKVELLEVELEKYQFVRNAIAHALASEKQPSESDWQKLILNFLLLIFPKYVQVLEKVRIADFYSSPGERRHREIDVALVDAVGNLDVIEIKRPFDDALVSRGDYRGNHVPTRELSGTIMQAEKYLFHLTKWGTKGETELSEKYRYLLPKKMMIKVTNPKALIIIGRDRKRNGRTALTPAQMFDFEVIKRKYANMVDIITYDDLLRRLDNIIASFKRRIDEDKAFTRHR